jgi:hypothetical protein
MHDFEEEHTEVLSRVMWEKKPPSMLWLGGAAMWFTAAVALTVCAPPSTHTLDDTTVTALQHEAVEIGLTIDAAARTAHQRAAAIAQTPMLRAAILTDAATVADIMTSELKFQRSPGEVVELFQVRNGKLESLIRLPASARPLPATGDAEVTTAQLDDTGPRVVVSAHVRRIKDAEGYEPGITGMFMLSGPVGVGAIRQQLAGYAADAALVQAGRSVLLVHQPDVAAGEPMSIEVPSTTAQLTLTAAPLLAGHRAPWIELARNISLAAGAVMAIGFGLLLVLYRRQRKSS